MLLVEFHWWGEITGSVGTSTMEYINIASGGNAVEFGDLTMYLVILVQVIVHHQLEEFLLVEQVLQDSVTITI